MLLYFIGNERIYQKYTDVHIKIIFLKIVNT
jgi:hypothetical protein